MLPFHLNLNLIISCVLITHTLDALSFSPLQVLMDSENGIVCPSGDLQQCSQQLGLYNKTTCPGGTVCERFPIMVPGFQDFCCWENGVTDEEDIIIFGSTPQPEEEQLPKSTEIEESKISEILLPTILRPTTRLYKKVTKITNVPRGHSGKGSKKVKKGRRTTTPLPTTTVELTTSTTTYTTTPKPKTIHRGPRCSNPEDTALIDFGNRLRDCYYTQCQRGYRCEMNRDLRRYICCGKEVNIYLPPGLPPLPSPSPLVPNSLRPQNRNMGPPNGVPFYYNEGEMKNNQNYNLQISESNNYPRQNENRQAPIRRKPIGRKASSISFQAQGSQLKTYNPYTPQQQINNGGAEDRSNDCEQTGLCSTPDEEQDNQPEVQNLPCSNGQHCPPLINHENSQLPANCFGHCV